MDVTGVSEDDLREVENVSLRLEQAIRGYKEFFGPRSKHCIICRCQYLEALEACCEAIMYLVTNTMSENMSMEKFRKRSEGLALILEEEIRIQVAEEAHPVTQLNEVPSFGESRQ